ncbi:OsmC family protein [Chryseobacterium aquifrigidense]|uniref:OsmC-like protein n=1 Tax=Chryseobacterium aquifrigidense TaxID=558021 RepID=A0A543EHP6_9FLAO|nr:OsmC family protein [Chryseobacterium aquifrigidense]TQM21081.1 OsmC-like protein [Chryseobacterium aquifrigidense]
MSKIVSTNYEGKYKSTTSTPLNNEIPITVNAGVFTPVDLLASAYGSCLLGTIDYEAQKKNFSTDESRSEIEYEMGAGNKIAAISIKLFFKNSYNDEQKNIIENAAKELCHVGNSIDQSIARRYEFFYSAE